MFHLFRFLRWLGRFALIVYFAAGIAVLGLRYWVLPNVDQWKVTIERQLSQALGAQVTLGEVEAQWLGTNPRLTLTSVSIRDAQHGEILNLPYLRAVLSWRSVADASVRFASLDVAGLDLTLRRDAQGQIWVLGQSFAPQALADGQDDDVPGVPRALAWLAAQPSINVSDVTLRWIDAYRDAPPIVLHQASLKLRNHRNEHRFALSVSPPHDLARMLELRGEFRVPGGLAPGVAPDLSRVQGRLYARGDALLPAAWRPWMDVPAEWVSGGASVQASLEVAGGKPGQVSLDASLQNAHWASVQSDPPVAAGQASPPPADEMVVAQAARLHVDGPWEAIAWAHAPASASSQPAPGTATLPDDASVMRVQLQARDVRITLSDVFAQPLSVTQLRLNGWAGAQADGRARMGLDELSVSNADLDVTLRGTWRDAPGTEAGLTDLQGQFKQMRVPAIVDYLPNFVDADARQWMQDGLLGGWVRDADLTVNGDLAHFPFGDAPEKGDFLLDGRMQDVIIDYAPSPDDALSWPRLEAIQGRLRMQRVDMQLQADSATMPAGGGQPPIVLSGIQARIPNIERDAELTVQGLTRASASSHLAFMRHSPLGDILDGVFEEATGTGEWEIPLSLFVPLQHSLDLTLNGQVRFLGGSLRLMPEMPVFERLRGAMSFTETGITAQGLGARFLGGNLAVAGGLGGKQSGLRLSGRVQADALQQYVGLEGMRRLQGSTAYSVLLRRDAASGFGLTLQSDLKGMALDFPAPYGKPAERAMALTAQWLAAAPLPVQRAESQDAPVMGQELTIELDQHARARLLRRSMVADGPYFQAAAVAVRQPLPAIMADGLHVDVNEKQVDVGAWNRIIDTFSRPLPAAPAVAVKLTARPPRPPQATPVAAADPVAHGDRSLLPELQSLRVQADAVSLFGLDMTKATLTATQGAGERWRMDISSTETAGTLYWQEADGRIEGKVQAKFDRMTIGSAEDRPDAATAGQAGDVADASGSSLHDELDIPAVDLSVRRLTLFGYPLGALSLTGLNQERGRMWRLEQLNLIGDGLHLQGNGHWRLTGPQRGLSLDASAKVTNMGAYLAQLRIDGIMAQGQGTVEGKFFWHDLPWSLALTNVQGDIKVALDKGRFSRVNSRVARLLELLSIQSLTRLARMDTSLDGVMREGFPFDMLRGDIALRRGMLETQGYRVVGPVGTIVIGGSVNLRAQSQNLQAVVIPSLDVSGAALAAGIAVNPIVGVGAFLAQWLLQAPLAKAMTVEYRIDGTWDEPDIQELKSRAAAAP